MKHEDHLDQIVNPEHTAQQQYEEGVPGFYVAIFATGTVVAGPFKALDTAEYQAALREPPSMCVGEIR